jgi:superfamily II DNA/RNA helicase
LWCQVLAVSKSICHHARLRCTVITGGDKYGLQKKALEAPQDLLICTPGRLLKHAEDGNVFLGDVRYLVLDEADTMFDAGFGEDIKKLLRPMKNKTSRSVGVFASLSYV